MTNAAPSESSTWRTRINTAQYFGTLAAQYSVEPGSQALRGEVPPIKRNGGQPLLEKEAFALKPGELSGVISVDDKFVILRCEGFTKPTEVEFAKVRDDIYQDLLQKKMHLAMSDCFERLQESATIDNFLAGTSQSPNQPAQRREIARRTSVAAIQSATDEPAVATSPVAILLGRKYRSFAKSPAGKNEAESHASSPLPPGNTRRKSGLIASRLSSFSPIAERVDVGRRTVAEPDVQLGLLLELLAAEPRHDDELAGDLGQAGHVAPELLELGHREDVLLAVAPALLHVLERDVGGQPQARAGGWRPSPSASSARSSRVSPKTCQQPVDA